MSKHKVGDKIVLEITGINELGSYIFGDITYSWLVSSGFFDKFSKPLSEYTEKLEKKNENKQKRIEKLVERLHRQAAEITRLLAENAELKGLNSTICDVCKSDEFIKETWEQARAAGQRESWELALKLRYMDYEDKVECFDLEYDGKEKWIEIMEKYTYTEAAAKVADWKKAKEEICVGDVVECEGSYGVVVGAGEVYVKGFTSDWTPFQWMKQDCTKTGRHIDVNAWMAQIGGER